MIEDNTIDTTATPVVEPAAPAAETPTQTPVAPKLSPAQCAFQGLQQVLATKPYHSDPSIFKKMYDGIELLFAHIQQVFENEFKSGVIKAVPNPQPAFVYEPATSASSTPAPSASVTSSESATSDAVSSTSSSAPA